MNTSFLPILLCCIALCPAVSAPKAPAQAKHYTIYAEFLQNTPVEISTGAKWEMDKGDCFPVYMFKDQQTTVVLNLGGATFTTSAANVRIMKDSETAAAVESYRKNVAEFLKTQADKWKKDMTDAAKVKPN